MVNTKVVIRGQTSDLLACGLVASPFLHHVFPNESSTPGASFFSTRIRRKCIAQHLMNRRECFFCKATVTAVVDEDGKVIPDLKPPPPPELPSLDGESPVQGSPGSGPTSGPSRPGAGAADIGLHTDDVDHVVSYTLPFRNRSGQR